MKETSDDELHEPSLVRTATRQLGRRRVAHVGAALTVAVAVVVGTQALLGAGWFASELWLGTLASLVVLLIDLLLDGE